VGSEYQTISTNNKVLLNLREREAAQGKDLRLGYTHRMGEASGVTAIGENGVRTQFWHSLKAGVLAMAVRSGL
jgi:hypothetical protein